MLESLKKAAGRLLCSRVGEFLLRLQIDAHELAGGGSYSMRAKERGERSPQAFEDLSFLFNCHKFNRALIRMDFDEAAYLFGLAASLPGDAVCLDIGMNLSGSTILLAAAVAPAGKVISFHSEPEDDAGLMTRLESMGLDHKVQRIVGDPRAPDISAPSRQLDLVFLDGDLSYEGVSHDFKRWKRFLKPGGHMIFHDAAQARPYATCQPGPSGLVDEILDDPAAPFKKVHEVASLVHLRSTRTAR